MQLIKGGYSYRLRKELGIEREAWQPGYSDHRLRDLSDYRIHLIYLENNPVKRGLCQTPQAFPYSSACGKFELGPSTSVAKAERLAMLWRHG
jgi:putative transposase